MQEPAHVYVITRLDLPHPHLTVQVFHAGYAAAMTYGRPGRTHPNAVVCAVAGERELDDEFNRLKEKGVPCLGFYEEDMGGELTAVATAPLLVAD